jgi:hypothetical protein
MCNHNPLDMYWEYIGSYLDDSDMCVILIDKKSAPLHAMHALRGRGCIAPTHS